MWQKYATASSPARSQLHNTILILVYARSFIRQIELLFLVTNVLQAGTSKVAALLRRVDRLQLAMFLVSRSAKCSFISVRLIGLFEWDA